jgi:hypothetical protein
VRSGAPRPRRQREEVDGQREEVGGLDNIRVADDSGGWLRYRYR